MELNNRPLVLKDDRISRIKKLFHYDDATGDVTIETRQHLDPVLGNNQEMRNAARSGWKGDMHLVASIPKVVWNSLPEGIREDMNELRKWLDQSDQKVFRTKEGTLL